MDPNQNNQTPPSSPQDPATSIAPPPIVSPPVAAPSPVSQPADPLTEEVEKDLVAHIIENLEKSTITVEQAQALAKEFLALLPFQDKQDLVKKLDTLGDKYTEAQAIYVKFAGPLVEEERQRKITEMAAHIKAGNLDQALAVVKGGPNATTTGNSNT